MHLPRITVLLLLTAAWAGPPAAFAQDEGAPPLLDEGTRTEAVQRLAEIFRDSYAVPGVGLQVADTLHARLRRGAYDGAETGDALAAELSRQLLELTRDQHLQVFYSAAPQAWVPDPAEPAEARTRREDEARSAGRLDNFGFAEAEVLPGNVGYLRLTRLPPPALSGEAAAAAMRFLANADALIIDLRATGGGDFRTAALLQSWLLGPQPVHLTTIRWRDGGREEQVWTESHVAGPRLLAQPVYVLTSARTFSAPEHVAYELQSLRRATVVGERTGGGALPGRTFALTPHFAAWVSTGVPVSPVTGGNWEAAGIQPDIETPAASALARAHAEAATVLARSSSDPSRRRRLEWIAERLQAQARPVTVPDALLRSFAGRYGPRTVRFEAGGLVYQRGDGPRYRLIPLADSLFALEGNDEFRIRFERDGRGRVTALTGLSVDGGADPSPRLP